MLVRYSETYILDDLEKKRLSVSKVSTFNDPFELHLMPSEHPTRAEAASMIAKMFGGRPKFVERLRERFHTEGEFTYESLPSDVQETLITGYLAKQTELIEKHRATIIKANEELGRVICFSKEKPDNPEEIPMWGYYAGKHTGLRVGMSDAFFQRGSFDLKEIEYPESPPMLPLRLHPVLDRAEFNAFSKAVIKSKSKAWKHEEEMRLLILRSECFEAADAKGVTQEYVNILPEEVLRLDVGINFDPALEDRVINLRAIYPQLEIFKASKRGDCYAISYAPL